MAASAFAASRPEGESEHVLQLADKWLAWVLAAESAGEPR